jgi:hypothetical protein
LRGGAKLNLINWLKSVLFSTRDFSLGLVTPVFESVPTRLELGWIHPRGRRGGKR